MFELTEHQCFVDGLTMPVKRNKGITRTVIMPLRVEPDQVYWPESVAALQALQIDQLNRSDEGNEQDTIAVKFKRVFPRATYTFKVHDDSFQHVQAQFSIDADVKGAPEFRLVKGVIVCCWKIEAHVSAAVVAQLAQAVGSEGVLLTIQLAQVSIPLLAHPLPGDEPAKAPKAAKASAPEALEASEVAEAGAEAGAEALADEDDLVAVH